MDCKLSCSSLLSQEALVLLGAKYGPCMRRDRQLFEGLEESTRQEASESGCCVRRDSSGCVQVPSADRCPVSVARSCGVSIMLYYFIYIIMFKTFSTVCVPVKYPWCDWCLVVACELLAHTWFSLSSSSLFFRHHLLILCSPILSSISTHHCTLIGQFVGHHHGNHLFL